MKAGNLPFLSLVNNLTNSQCHFNAQRPDELAPAGTPPANQFVVAKRLRGGMKTQPRSANTHNNLGAIKVIFKMPGQLSLTLPSFAAVFYNDPTYSFFSTEPANLKHRRRGRHLLISDNSRMQLTSPPLEQTMLLFPFPSQQA